MRRAGAGLLIAGAAMIAGCGGNDQSTIYQVLPASSASPSASVPARATAAGSPPAAAVATPIPDGGRIIIDSPNPSTSIQSPVPISGTASVDGGNVVAVVLDAAGRELGRGATRASAAAPAFGRFDIVVSFNGASPGTSGQIKVFGVNPRDGTTPTWFYFITVRFS